MLELVEEYGLKGLATMTGALAAKILKLMLPRERRLGLSRRFYTDLLAVSTATTGASAEEGEFKNSTTTPEALS